MMSNISEKDLQVVADYLYHKGITVEQYRAISTLRQLINEEFKPQKQVSNQFIYDVIKEILWWVTH